MTTKMFDQFNLASRWILCGLPLDQVQNFVEHNPDESGALTVHMTVNGFEVDFETVATRLDAIFDEAVERRAHDIAIETDVDTSAIVARLWDIKTQIDDMSKSISASINDLEKP
jgi:type II secretory ATPase GspE/PulE/Tfp pilus assembly ATPase PilB-like protein